MRRAGDRSAGLDEGVILALEAGRRRRAQSRWALSVTPLIVLDVVGLSARHIGPDTPNLSRLASRGAMRTLATVTPAVTCTVQSTMLTGLPPDRHGAVANGWFFDDLGEIFFWRQSARLISGERVWEAARRLDPGFTCANLFWWYAMHTSADISVTPRPMYLADGRKIPDCWAQPPGLREELTRTLGAFPLFSFWGPATSIEFEPLDRRLRASHSSHPGPDPDPRLSAASDSRFAEARAGPPCHRDGVARDRRRLRRADRRCRAHGAGVLVVSEYGITPVSTPIFINRALRKAGWLEARDELGGEQLDLSASAAFAVADHQIAHVYVRRKELMPSVAALLEGLDGVETVLAAEERGRLGLDHPRSGDLVALARRDAWFVYYYWLDDARAPDYARTVEIHRKLGYDPVELFFDPRSAFRSFRSGGGSRSGPPDSARSWTSFPSTRASCADRMGGQRTRPPTGLSSSPRGPISRRGPFPRRRSRR